MKGIKTLVHALYNGGRPILMEDGCWHVEWQCNNGKTRVTGFGWKDKQRAQQHIETVMANK